MSRLETVKAKYPSIDWNLAKTADPSKNFKYLDWIGSNFAKSTVPELKDVLIKFEKYSSKLTEKEIAKYDVSSLKKTLEALGPSNKEAKEMGCIALEDVGDIKIVMLEGKEAVTKYTAGTRWCISNYNTFLGYAKKNNIFVLTSNKVKMALVVNPSYSSNYSLWLPNDTNLNIKDGAIKYFLDFMGYDGSVFGKVIDKCTTFSKQQQNMWYGINRNITTDALDKIISAKYENLLLDFVWREYSNYSYDRLNINTFLRLVARNKDKYPTLVAAIESSKLSHSVWDSSAYSCYGGGYVPEKLCDMWTKMLKSLEQPKVVVKKMVRKSVKKVAKLKAKTKSKRITKIVSKKKNKAVKRKLTKKKKSKR